MNVKRIIFFLLALSGCFSLSAQEAKDVVLVVDTSAGMFSYYNEVNTYLTGPFLAENLRFGDTLHIISFASKPRFEIARRLLGKDDIETVSGRIWLLYPLENNTGSADSSLNYAEQYVRSIPGGRGKKVFVVSDNESVGTLTNSLAERLKPNSVDVIFIRASERMSAGTAARTGGTPRVPQAATASPGGNTTTGTGNTAAENTATGNTATGNTATGNTADGNVAAGNNPADSGAVTDSSGSGQTAESNEEDGQTVEQADGLSLGDPADGATGGQDDSGGPDLSQNGDEPVSSGIQPAAVQPPASARSGGSDALPLPLLLGLLLLLLLLIIIIMAIRKRGFPSGKRAAFTRGKGDGSAAKNAELLNNFASRQAESSIQGLPRRSQYKDPGRFPTDPPMLNIFVEEQNTAIGRRNIHTLKKGNTYSIGGGASDFLIFLVPVPYKVAELYFDGNNCTFTPLKPNYFPDLGSASVPECIGKTIRLLSDKNYEVFFHFERYKDPLIALNQLLHSIQAPEEQGGEKKVHP
ncbi:MAG: hypothetical protein LBB72_01110 [Spirochaetaceae bacterium]|jgi:hypothetical protein|nr:hypothetical protein [Spirochaetaceae bacterium]